MGRDAGFPGPVARFAGLPSYEGATGEPIGTPGHILSPPFVPFVVAQSGKSRLTSFRACLPGMWAQGATRGFGKVVAFGVYTFIHRDTLRLCRVCNRKAALSRNV